MSSVVVAMTGASGAIYGCRLLQVLLAKGTDVDLVISDSARVVLEQELSIALAANGELSPSEWLARLTSPPLLQTVEHDAALQWADDRLRIHSNADFLAPIASGSHLTRAMVICPCSGSTLAGVAHGTSGNLIQRAAEVHLKERRKLILVTRETPLSTIHLQNQLAVANSGGLILPASPGWYHGVDSLLGLVDFIVVRILDQLGEHCDLMERWGGSTDAP